ncbi:hypothetical protein O6H91_Y114500 [Diphasiastrum complanatum]|nr:hypothetical protein O6H91_Y114500 [Diphasiastrum complanatum]
MLEKLGLPPRPAARGSSWVLDASHCQACASPFSIFNRKHHCRRCGSLFCGTCTQQRIVLRGQGDGPVRICEACKKLEDATRFEARYGRKAKLQKGNLLSGEEGLASSSDQAYAKEKELQISVGSSIDCKESGSKESVSPEVLRQQAQEEKSKYSLLKREGKSAEALKAFKRGKELERQADALALSIRKSARMALAAASQANAPNSDAQRTILQEDNKIKPSLATEEQKEVKKNSRRFVNDQKARTAPQDEKDEYAEALKELGWTEADLSKSETKEKNPPDAVSKTPTTNTPAYGSLDSGSMQMEILGHKRRALALKREGKLGEAKEELKKAKLLERQLQELEVADSEEEPEDELAALMKSLEKTEDVRLKGLPVSETVPAQELTLDANFWTNIGDGADDDNSHELVTEDDMNDPDMISALRSMGWTEEAAALERFSAPGDNKKEATADELKLMAVTEGDMYDPQMLAMLRALESDKEPIMSQVNSAASAFNPRQVSVLQQEVLSLKKAALSLRREGKSEQAKEELRQAKHLEQKLLRLQAEQSTKENFQYGEEDLEVQPLHQGKIGKSDEADDLVEVTDTDMHDPELMNILKGLGWQEESMLQDMNSSEVENLVPDISSLPQPTAPRLRLQGLVTPHLNKSELQKSLLGRKRNALMLRRQGKLDEAEEELKAAKTVERQLEQLQAVQESGKVDLVISNNAMHFNPTDGYKFSRPADLETEDDEVTIEDMNDPGMLANLLDLGWKDAQSEAAESSIDSELEGHHKSTESKGDEEDSFPKLDIVFSGMDATHISKDKKLSGQSTDSARETLASNKSALVQSVKPTEVDNKGEIVVSTETSLASAKLNQDPNIVGTSSTASTASLQQEILAYKRRALAYKREGSLADAKKELSYAKVLETQFDIQKVGATFAEHEPVQTVRKAGADVLVFQSIIQESKVTPLIAKVAQVAGPPLEKPIENKNISGVSGERRQTAQQHAKRGKDRMKLQRESLAHKRKALALRREGKIEEADSEFQLAKSLEQQMEELEDVDQGHGSVPSGSGLVRGNQSSLQRHPDDGLDMVDDVFDPQILSALKGLGWKESDILGNSENKSARGAPVNMSQMHTSSIEPVFTMKTGNDPGSLHGSTQLAGSEKKRELEQEIKAHKLQAVELKRAGKQGDALNALREAKRLEKILVSMAPQ